MIAPLVAFPGPPPRLVSLLDVFKENTLDSEWLPYCQKEKLLPLTADVSRSNNGPKLSLICQERGHAHVVISPKVRNQPVEKVAQCIIGVWGELEAVWHDPKDVTRFSLQFDDKRLRAVLRKR